MEKGRVPPTQSFNIQMCSNHLTLSPSKGRPKLYENSAEQMMLQTQHKKRSNLVRNIANDVQMQVCFTEKSIRSIITQKMFFSTSNQEINILIQLRQIKATYLEISLGAQQKIHTQKGKTDYSFGWREQEYQKNGIRENSQYLPQTRSTGKPKSSIHFLSTLVSYCSKENGNSLKFTTQISVMASQYYYLQFVLTLMIMHE